MATLPTPSSTNSAVAAELAKLNAAIAANTALLKKLSRVLDILKELNKEFHIMDFTALTAELTNNTSVEESAITLIQSLAGELATAEQQLANGDTAAAQTTLNGLTTELQTNDTALAAAIAANTPAAPGASAPVSSGAPGSPAADPNVVVGGSATGATPTT